MKLKVHASPNDGICARCRNGLVARFTDGHEATYCTVSAQPIRVLKPVAQCTDFEDRRQESEYEMRKIAWTVRTDKSGRAVGFAPPPERKDD